MSKKYSEMTDKEKEKKDKEYNINTLEEYKNKLYELKPYNKKEDEQKFHMKNKDYRGGKKRPTRKNRKSKKYYKSKKNRKSKKKSKSKKNRKSKKRNRRRV
tara:strand:+ start:846 stop:1148 length:303 start_codon:yes stop_codon:yes gene_type:complete